MKVLLLLQITAVTLLLSNCQNKFPEIDPNHSKNPITTITFGSCNRQTLAQPLWQPITENKPDLWIWLGDNIYGDSDTMAVMKAKYDLQKANIEYQKLTSTTPIIGIWDDHDYGRNDAGKGYLMKKESKNLMLEFLGEPAISERRMHEGAYHSYTYGPIAVKLR